ncbi:Purple acid phosphatase 17 [Diplonema papillatum]|nr:Purple acid phosphatase 17 [Diplonema papillatum]
MSIGDNFYPSGATEANDVEFMMWKKVFLSHETRSALRVPWKVVLGNHDYDGNFQCQIDFTTHPENPDGLWQMPDNKYSFTYPAGPNGQLAAFFGFDANATQLKVRSGHPNLLKQWPLDVAWLKAEVTKYPTAAWKILYLHHPLCTKGRGHLEEARRLRSKTYTRNGTVQSDGMDLEAVLHQCGFDVVLAGHEHMFQQHFLFRDKDAQGKHDAAHLQQHASHIPMGPTDAGGRPGQDAGIIHATVGAATEAYFWRGKVPEEPMAWVACEGSSGSQDDEDSRGPDIVTGFAACGITTEPVSYTAPATTRAGTRSSHYISRFVLRFISSVDGSIVREVMRTKLLPG